MKKRDGGYVLVYVLIVIVLVSALGLSVCSVALRNLQAQERETLQMKDTYAAEGEVERFYAWLLSKQFDIDTFMHEVGEYPGEPGGTPEALSGVKVEVTGPTEPGDLYTVTFTSTSGSMKVEAVMSVTATTVTVEPEEPGTSEEPGGGTTGEPTEPTPGTSGDDTEDDGTTGAPTPGSSEEPGGDSGDNGETVTFVTVTNIKYESYNVSAADTGEGGGDGT